MATREALEAVKAQLKDGGIYAANLLGSPDRLRSVFFKSEVKTICSVFNYVWLQKDNPKKDDTNNWLIIASDTDYGYDSEKLPISADDIIFTDDYSPVEFFCS